MANEKTISGEAVRGIVAMLKDAMALLRPPAVKAGKPAPRGEKEKKK